MLLVFPLLFTSTCFHSLITVFCASYLDLCDMLLLELDGRESACNAGDLGSVPGLGRSSGEGNGNQLQYSCLENSMDKGAWQAIVHGVTKSQT